MNGTGAGVPGSTSARLRTTSTNRVGVPAVQPEPLHAYNVIACRPSASIGSGADQIGSWLVLRSAASVTHPLAMQAWNCVVAKPLCSHCKRNGHVVV